MATKIEWCDETINPVIGCSKISAGCTNCYAVSMAHRLGNNIKAPRYEGLTRDANTWTGETRLVESELLKPLKWKKGRRIFVGSMTDLFHDATPFMWIDRVFAAMAMCPQHTFMLLTKRPERMLAYFNARTEGDPWAEAADEIADLAGIKDHPFMLEPEHLPLQNVWLGVTVEDQEAASTRIPLLLETPAAVRFISAEPLLDGMNLEHIINGENHINALTGERYEWHGGVFNRQTGPRLDQVIVGAETGPKKRPMNPASARNIRDQCVSAGVAFFFKKDSDGNREIDGRLWGQFPSAKKAVAA